MAILVNGSGGYGSAADIEYNNATSGMTAKNVQSAIDELASKEVTYGTEDLTAGTSPLETGKLYFVYE